MKKSGWKFLVGIVLVAVLSGACVEPFGPPEDPVEYDAQGRRLVTINVDVEKAARAVNADIARTYIDFYEVVFKGPGTANEYYGAVAKKGAGNRLSLRVPDGDYTAYLHAGYVDPEDNKVVLLAYAAITTAQPASTDPWTFSLTALNLGLKSSSPVSTDPIYVAIAGAGVVYAADTGIPYYAPTATQVVSVTVNTGVTTHSGGVVDIQALINKNDATPAKVPSDLAVTSAFTPAGTFIFGFTTPPAATLTKGILNIGFDVTVVTYASTRNNGIAPVSWHIRNGLNIYKHDNGDAADPANTGAGLLFAFGGAKPAPTDTYIPISVGLPSVP
jgi:hypothetical protein